MGRWWSCYLKRGRRRSGMKYSRSKIANTLFGTSCAWKFKLHNNNQIKNEIAMIKTTRTRFYYIPFNLCSSVPIEIIENGWPLCSCGGIKIRNRDSMFRFGLACPVQTDWFVLNKLSTHIISIFASYGQRGHKLFKYIYNFTSGKNGSIIIGSRYILLQRHYHVNIRGLQVPLGYSVI